METTRTPQELQSCLTSGLLSFPLTDFDSTGEFDSRSFAKRIEWLGGYGARGRSDAEAEKIVSDAKALDAAGAFAIVVEGVVEPIAIAATKAVSCPTIGIGASAQCDGQVLVTEDMLGMFERVPRFVKRYEDIAGVIDRTVARYAEEVRTRAFPGEDQTYQPKS